MSGFVGRGAVQRSAAQRSAAPSHPLRTSSLPQDNDAHDKAVDSLVNFETVKYFTNEEYELNRYATAMEHFQKASVATQASLNVLNAIQQAIIYLALLGSTAVREAARA